jgi:hypothetical protein
MTMQTTSNSNSSSEKPAPESCKAGGIKAVPALPQHCNSWIAEVPSGRYGYKGSRFVELFQRSDAATLAAAGWTVRTAADHLAMVNAEARA